MNVLLAADSASMRAILRSMLRHFGARKLVEAGNCDEALTAATTAKIDLIVLHLVREPGPHSFDCLEQLRGNGLSSPAVVVGVSSDDPDEARGKKLDVVQYLTKPFNLETLYAALGSAMREAEEDRRTRPRPGNGPQ
jgi:DNA-binding response OmpR family regulator